MEEGIILSFYCEPSECLIFLKNTISKCLIKIYFIIKIEAM